ncbi:nucleotidyltransferase family protein [Paenibacillus radicis (ex Xue et al. 2023)]|uniref:Nucleotidyltransferase family protein n=1 Tax=Paenibacillus radicis (ex Xue et al. 2023) TaxID=2972489 RepID=A0ABT1YRQ3_9BACL|nr:nucleotidyltransferase family protein [Paenibacillus radicis (ex Xue et al. 2023)]MCR8635420.1 nucleotidyltransferase family protein [Paenibacillus radicis (ex Xue et al. 2023)]
MVVNLIQAIYDSRLPWPDPNDGMFYEQALADIHFFEIGSQVYFLLKQRGLLEQTPLFFQEALKETFTEVLYQNMLIKNQTVQMMEKFEEAGIQMIPLKGVIFAETYFGHIGARWTSDIDLLIKRSDLDKAIQAVKSLGFTYEEECVSTHFHWSFSKSMPGASIPLTVELHWDLLKAGTSQFKIDEVWDQAASLESYTFIQQLSEFHTFYMICLHGWRHHLSSLKYFIDIIQLIYYLKDRVAYSRLLESAAGHKTYKRISRTLRIVYREFPQLEYIVKLPLERRTNLWWDYSAIRDSNNSSLKYYLNYMTFHLMDFDLWKHCVAGIMEWLMPSKAAIGYELGRHDKGNSLVFDYLMLYKKRFFNFFRTIRINKTP